MDEFNIIVENEEATDVRTDIQNDFLKGDKGDKGDSNTLTIGTVEKGEEAEASIRGESPNQILDLVLPKGDKGDKGEKPEKGIDYFTTEEKQEIVQDVVKEVNAFDIKIVEELPTEDIRTKVIYFVPKIDEEEQNVYDEYIYINNQWEHIGSTKVDLTDYYKKEETDTIINDIEDKTIIDKTTILGQTSQEGTPSPDNIVAIKNVNVYGVNEFDKDNCTIVKYAPSSTNIGDDTGYLYDTNNEYGISFDVSKFTKITVSKQKGSSFKIAGLTNKPTSAGSCVVLAYENEGTQATIDVTNYNYVVIDFWNATKDTVTQDEMLSTIKIEEGEGTSYTPYNYGLLDLNLQKDTDTKTVTLISKRLHEGDSIDENGFHYENGTLVLKGDDTEFWWNYTTGVGGYGITYTHKGLDTSGKCSHYPKDTSQAFTDENAFRVSSSGFNFNVMPTFPTLAEWKAYVAEQYANGTPITLEYKLKQEENEPFDETNQTAWNTLENLLLQGYTFIDSSSDELQPTITLLEHTANEIYRENVDKFKELNNRDIYSTEEQIIGKWIDGKPLYRKVIDFGALPNNTTKNVNTGLTNVTYVKIEAIAHNSVAFINIPAVSATAVTSNIYMGILNNLISMKTGVDYSSYTNCYVTLNYTKTTD